MADAICSADLEQLARYAAECAWLEGDLERTAGALAASLREHESRCTEYRVDVSGLAESMAQSARAAGALAEWVGQVGKAFFEAGAWSAGFAGGLWQQYMYPELWDAFVALCTRLDAPGVEEALEFEVDLLGFLGALASRGDLRSIFIVLGRVGNTLTGKLGHVGRMKRLYDALVVDGVPYRGTVDSLLRSNAFRLGSLFLAGAVGAYYDWRTGTYGGFKSVAVHGLNAGVKIGIEKGLMRVVPGLGPVFIINDMVQLGTKAQVVVHRTLADLGGDAQTKRMLRQDATAIANAAARADLGNITKAFSESVFDHFVVPQIEQAQAVLKGLGEIAQQPSWETLQRVSGEYMQAVQASYPPPPPWAQSPVGSLIYYSNPLIYYSSPLKSVAAETGAAAIDVLDGAVDWAAATTLGAVNLGLAALDNGVQATGIGGQYGLQIYQALRR